MPLYYSFTHQYVLNGGSIGVRIGGGTLYETNQPDGRFRPDEILVEEPGDQTIGETYTYLGRFMSGGEIAGIAVRENWNLGRTFILTYDPLEWGDTGFVSPKPFKPTPPPVFPQATHGNDTINATNYHYETIRLHLKGGDDRLFGVSGSTDHTVWGDKGNDTLSLAAGDDFLYGGAGHDTLDGRWGDDRLYGGNGRDVLKGDDGKDRLFGENGNDILYGGNGNDILSGGRGNDLLSGYYGADRFVFANGDGRDHILDFQIGYDKIDFRNASGIDSVADLQFRKTPDGLAVIYGDDRVILDGIARGSAADIDFLF